jgi:hypothetical protein
MLARMQVAGNVLRISIDRAWVDAASLPITVDPLISASAHHISFQSSIESRIDSAYSVTSDAFIAVYQEDMRLSALAPSTSTRIMAGRFAADASSIDVGASNNMVAGDTDALVVTGNSTIDFIAPKVAWTGGATNKYLAVWLNRAAKSVEGAILNPLDPAGALSPTLLGTIAALGPGDGDIDEVVVGGRADGLGWCVAWHVTATAAANKR